MATSTVRETSIEFALSVLRRRKWWGLAAFAATLSLAVPFALVLPDVYRGVATVIVENSEGSSNYVKASIPELDARLITIQQELLSRARLSILITRLDLYPTWRRRGEPMETLVNRLRRDIHVEISRTDRGRPSTSGLRISYIGLDPKSAAAVPNTLASLYVEENSRMRAQQTSEMAEFLRQQLDTARRTVDDQETRLNRFKEQRAGHLPEQVSINMVTLERLNTRLRLNTDDQLRVRERLERLAGVTPVETGDPLQALQVRLADLQSRFTDRHPDVIRVKEQIREAERDRGAAKSIPSSALRRPEALIAAEAELASLQREERSVRSEIAGYEQRIQWAPRVEQELKALELDYNNAKDSYASLQKRYEEAQLAASLERTKNAESFRILDPAIVPIGPAAPNRMRLLMMAIFFAMAAGIGTMVVREHLDTSFHTVGELRQFTSIPVLATIPVVRSRIRLTHILRVAFAVVAVLALCALMAGFGYRTARGNTQLVWMLSAPQL